MLLQLLRYDKRNSLSKSKINNEYRFVRHLTEPAKKKEKVEGIIIIVMIANINIINNAGIAHFI